jgi:hypothetical protein
VIFAWLAGDADALALHAHVISETYDAYLTTRRSYYAMKRRGRETVLASASGVIH